MSYPSATYPTMAEARAASVIWTEGIICAALARHLEYWRNTIVPNVYLGSGRREIDLALMTKAGLLWAFEVKVSLADWKRDAHKAQHARHAEPARFYYVVPDHLCPGVGRPTLPSWCPPHAGIITLRNERQFYTNENGSVTIVDNPRQSRVLPAKPVHRRPLTTALQIELLTKLGMRYWSHVCPKDMSVPVVIPPTEPPHGPTPEPTTAAAAAASDQA